MDLTDLIPETAVINKEIESEDGETIGEIELRFRPFNVEDESWLKRAYPGDKLKKVFDTMDMDGVSRIGFHQLENGCKRELMKIKFMEIDEDGEESEVSKTGPQKLGRLIRGYPDQVEVLQALLKTRGFSMPIIEELGDHLVGEMEGKLKAQLKK